MNLYNDGKLLTLEFDADDELSSYQTKMIANNSFFELVSFNAQVKCDFNTIEYDISDLISFDEIVNKYNEIVNKNEFERDLKVLEMKLDEYMLNKNNLLMRKDALFILKNEFLNHNKYVFKYIYMPLKFDLNDYEGDKKIILNDDKIYEKRLNKEMSLDKEALLDEILNEDEMYDKKQNKDNVMKCIITIIFLILLFVFRSNKIISILTLITYLLILFIMHIFKITDDQKEYETQFDDKTLLICSYPYLRKSLIDEKIFVNKEDFKIGKDKTNDFVIDSNCISRKHAHIIKKNNNYYIEDNDSTNHTYVNEEKINVGSSHILLNGDKIKFGKEQYQFYYEV